jgi:hypothetical protein
LISGSVQHEPCVWDSSVPLRDSRVSLTETGCLFKCVREL